MILFPTKVHWRDKSRIEWIDKGLSFLRDHYRQWEIHSMALPQVGCGLGGLPWTEVKQLIEQYLFSEPVDVEVYVAKQILNVQKSEEKMGRAQLMEDA